MAILGRSCWPFAIAALTITLFSGCGSSPQTPESGATEGEETAPMVVATSSILCNLAEQIAEATIDLTCLMGAGIDPHVYQPTPEDRKAIEDAELILYNGYDFEPSLENLIASTTNPAPKVAVAEVAIANPIMGEPHHHDHGDSHDHSHDNDHDHDHGSHAHNGHDPDHGAAASAELAPDPHVWHSAENGIQVVAVIRESLTQLVPEQSTFYEQNAQTLKAELAEIHDWIQAQIATIPANQRQLVTTHDALQYYGDAYGLTIEGALQGLSTEQSPTATRIRELVDAVQDAEVPTIFAEVTANPNVLQTIARDAGVQVSEQKLFADGLGEPGSGGDTYQTMLLTNTETIVRGLGGQSTAFVQ
ncbi:zinc ABC transporter solute-binding protein [Synechococcales cyanobacterium C]|uniref:Zinc ABC transporter solute-binding protein n=2 Tax=Petrachloros TaxID=2918834 RepID=A0A8K2A7C2_9CYAN|nr:zinc ABC transporter substrate-binding protein [Petrachloros mirabilis]NCJ05920.1 zinc ABC transporter solute-binding protein [Petrachloros mirabilis ULC683]